MNTNGNGRDYVRSGQRSVRGAAKQPGGTPLASLARVITGARRGEAVRFVDGDPLNLRRVNLNLEDRRGRPVQHRQDGLGSL